MGRQTGFFTVDSDDAMLLEICEGRGMSAIPKILESGISSPEPTTPLSFTRTPGTVFYLLPSGAAAKDAVYEPTDDGRLVLIPHQSPVVEFATCRRDDDWIENGRIYFAATKTASPFDAARKEFESLSRRVKKWVPADRFRFYIGPGALDAVRTGKLRLRHMKYELHPAES